jgi:hypothetical protein
MDSQQASDIQSEGLLQDTAGPATQVVPQHDDRRSFAQRQAQMAVRPATPFLVDGDRLMNPIERAPPGDIVERQPKNAMKQPGLAKRRSTYFEDAFSVKNTGRVREMVGAEALVVVELKTNVRVSLQEDFKPVEQALMTYRSRDFQSSIVTSLRSWHFVFNGQNHPSRLTWFTTPLCSTAVPSSQLTS